MSDAPICENCGDHMGTTVEDRPYNPCGIPGVTLEGVQVNSCENCGYEEVVVDDIREVDRQIAAKILERPGPYTTREAHFVSMYVCSGLPGWPWDPSKEGEA